MLTVKWIVIEDATQLNVPILSLFPPKGYFIRQIGSEEAGGPYPTPTEIEITVQEQKCTVFDSAVCQASKQIEQSRTWTWGSPYSEDTVSIMNLIIDEKSLNSGPFQYVTVINLQKNRRCMYSFCNLIFKWTSWPR